MNIANKVTMIRLILIPIFVGAFYHYGTSHNIAAILFMIASLTDAVDGHLARSRNLITNFGKFVDPLVDKVLTIAASIWGKAKTTSQMISLVLLLLNNQALNKFGIYVFYIAVILTLISGIDYIVKNKKVLDL